MILLIMDLNKNISERGIIKIILENIDYKNIKLYNQLIKKYGSLNDDNLYINETLPKNFVFKYKDKINWELLFFFKSHIFDEEFYNNNEEEINDEGFYYCTCCNNIQYINNIHESCNFCDFIICNDCIEENSNEC